MGRIKLILNVEEFFNMDSDLNVIHRVAQRAGQGLVVPIVTPFTADGEHVDPSALRALVQFLIRSQVHALITCGTTGEGALLRNEERQRITEVAVEAAAGQVPVLAQTGATTTAETIALTRQAQACGADAATVVTPYYFRLSNAALVAHYAALAEAVPDFPIFLYNIPQNTGNNLSPPVVAEIARRCPNVVGIKDSSGNLAQLAEDRVEVPRRFYTLVGSDRLILAAMANGADGAVAGNANAVPEPFVALFEAISAGDWGKARQAQEQITFVARILGDGGDLSLFKGVIKRRGLPVGPVRRPLLTAPEAEVDARMRELKAAGLSLPAVA
jgi:4-hydroxy-tetrahydrodipicolinate synthase